MPVFSSKNNYICGAFFNGESFLVLEFDNRKNKRTVRTKGEIGVAPFLDENFGLTDRVMLVEAAKKIRKNTKAKTIYINKKLNGVDLTHFFEIFSVAGFEKVRFVDIKETLNNAFRKKDIEGKDAFLVLEDDKYHLYSSDSQKEINLLATADSVESIDLSNEVIKDELLNVLDSRIEVFGLNDYSDFSKVEDKLYEFGFNSAIGNVWQNAFSINDHIPSIHFKESSRYAIPVSLALYALEDKEEFVSGMRPSRSISDELVVGKKEKEVVKNSVSKESKSDKKEVVQEPVVINEEIISENNFSTSIDLPILEENSKEEKMATYKPEVDNNLFEIWETFEEGDLEEAVKEVQREEEKDVEGQGSVVEDIQEEPVRENIVEEVLVEEDKEESFDFDEIMEKEEETEVEVEVVEGSKEIKEEEKDSKKLKKDNKRSFWSSLFGKDKKDRVEEDKETNNKNNKKGSSKKKRKKKSKNSKKKKKKKK